MVCRVITVVGALLAGLAGVAGAQSPRPGPDEMVNNPPFAHWAQFKPGTTVTQREVVTLPDGRKLEQTITYKLVRKGQDQLIVQSTVKDKSADAGQNTQTTTTYVARVKMRDISTAANPDVAVTDGKEEMSVKGKKLAVEWVEAVIRSGDEVWTEKMWTAREVPGGIIRQTLVHKRGDKVLSESVLEMVDFKPGF